MGGSMGNPIDEAAQARINQKIEDVVKTFGLEFSKVSFLFHLRFYRSDDFFLLFSFILGLHTCCYQ
jgi:hypothetical protein